MMLLSSKSFARMVAALRSSQKTCTVVEQCCGGIISSSIMAQPGASAVYYGGSTVYNTKKCLPLLLNDQNLHNRLQTASTVNEALSEEERYIQSKLLWTAETAKSFCLALDTDYGIAEGGASGPTFRPRGMSSGFCVIAVAGKQPDGSVSLLSQEIIRSKHADREKNMRFFADSAADIVTRAITGEGHDVASVDFSHERSNTALTLDRATHLRSDLDSLGTLQKSGSMYTVLHNNKILVKEDCELALLTNQECHDLLEGEKNSVTFLGLLTCEPEKPVFGIDVRSEKEPRLKSAYSFADTRTTAPLFLPINNEIALHATALAQWQRRTKYCSLCGGATKFINAGTCCECSKCCAKSWPRQDPSMIAVITSRDRERVLLAHSARHPPKLNTVLAGFVEAGETFEAAVTREAFEETGIWIDHDSIKYMGSQPWPFPQSCMVGFSATADDSQPFVIDKNEIESAHWFTRKDVAKAARIQGATMQKDVAAAAILNDPTIPLLIPPKGVIARALIDSWLSSD